MLAECGLVKSPLIVMSHAGIDRKQDEETLMIVLKTLHVSGCVTGSCRKDHCGELSWKTDQNVVKFQS